jgi:hypothetical protein
LGQVLLVPSRSESARLAYADPPYPGCAHLYPEKTEVDHADLIARLMADYDGWALSTNENALRALLPLAPDGVRILAWCKTNAPPFYQNPFPSWEPVLLWPARQDTARVRSYFASLAPTGHMRAGDIPGHKPEGFCEWVIRCLGARHGDTMEDLYPGTGVMGRTWERWRCQTTIPLETRAPRREVTERLLAAAHPALF